MLSCPYFLSYPIFSAHSDGEGHILFGGGGGGREYGIENQVDFVRVDTIGSGKPVLTRIASCPTASGIVTSIRHNKKTNSYLCTVKNYSLFLFCDSISGSIHVLRERETDTKPSEQENGCLDVSGTHCVTAHSDGSLRFWCLAWEETDRKSKIAKDPAKDKILPTADLGGALKKKLLPPDYSLKSMELRKCIQAAHENAVLDCDFSLDGTKVATASRDLSTKIWDVQTCRQLCTVSIPSSGGAVLMPRFSRFLPSTPSCPNRSELVIQAQGSRGPSTITFWKVDDNNGNAQMCGPVYIVDKTPSCSLDISFDGKLIALGLTGGEVKLISYPSST